MSSETDKNEKWIRDAERQSSILPGMLVYKKHHQEESQPFYGIVVREIDYTEWIGIMFADDPDDLGNILLRHDRQNDVDPAQWLHYEILWPDESRTIEGATSIRAVTPCE